MLGQLLHIEPNVGAGRFGAVVVADFGIVQEFQHKAGVVAAEWGGELSVGGGHLGLLVGFAAKADGELFYPWAVGLHHIIGQGGPVVLVAVHKAHIGVEPGLDKGFGNFFVEHTVAIVEQGVDGVAGAAVFAAFERAVPGQELLENVEKDLTGQGFGGADGFGAGGLLDLLIEGQDFVGQLAEVVLCGEFTDKFVAEPVFADERPADNFPA